MSTKWGYKCVIDGSVSPLWIVGGEVGLSGIVKAWPHIKAALDADIGGFLEISVLGCNYEDKNPLQWLAEHDGHHIVLINGYDKELELITFRLNSLSWLERLT